MFYRRHIFGPSPVEKSIMIILSCIIFSIGIILHLLIVKLPLYIYENENIHYNRMNIIRNIKTKQITELNTNSKIGDTIITVSNGPINTYAIDSLTSVKIENATTLRRVVHYCNIKESSKKVCSYYRRRICREYITKYSYNLGWVTDQIPSNQFNNPNGHYNPISKIKTEDFISDKIIFNSAETEYKVHLDTSLNKNIRTDFKHVIWTSNNKSYVDYHIVKLPKNKDPTYLPNLGIFYISFDGKVQSEFLNSGLFLENSHYNMINTLESNFKSCTPGDIVISYEAKIPEMLTVLGEVEKISINNIYLTKLKDTKDYINVQTVYGKKLSSTGLIHEEMKITRNTVILNRLITIIIIFSFYKLYQGKKLKLINFF